MAGSVTVTYSSKVMGPAGRKIEVVNVAWTADAADGSVPDTTLSGLYGYVVKAITNPGATAPTANYDIKLLDADDSTADVMNAALMDRHTTNTEIVYPSVSPFLCGNYTFNLTNNSVNSATGVLILYIDPR